MASVIQFLKDLGLVKLAAIGAAALALIIFVCVYAYTIHSGNMSVLYSNLDLQDSGKIVQELDAKKIPYELAFDGSVIKVPSEMVLRTRVIVAQAGLPSQGSVIGYEIFNNEETLGTTNFLQNVKLVRALEGELSRTVGSLDQVERARVHLVIPQREVFSREKQEPKASVVLKLKPHRSLSNPETDAIAHIVATAVPGLDVKNVTIVDTKGTPLKLGSQDPEMAMLGGSSSTDEYQMVYEQRLQKELEGLLANSLGADKVKVRVSADINFDRVVTNSETYDPDGAVVRSVQSISESERTPVNSDSTDVSIANNIPGLGPQNGDNSQNIATVDRSDDTTNYEISKTVRNHISETGEVKRLSVAVLVDGTYKIDPTTKVAQYTERSPEELKRIENLVKGAVGFREDRHDIVEVINMPFATDEVPVEKHEWMNDLPKFIETLIVAIVVVLIFVTVVRPVAMRIFDVKKLELKSAGLSRETREEVLNEVEIKAVDNVGVKKLAEVVQSHPQESLVILRRWMNDQV